MNITFNLGGIIGAFFGAALGSGFFVLLILLQDQPAMNSKAAQGFASFFLGGLIVGAIGANYLWGLLVKKK